MYNEEIRDLYLRIIMFFIIVCVFNYEYLCLFNIFIIENIRIVKCLNIRIE